MAYVHRPLCAAGYFFVRRCQRVRLSNLRCLCLAIFFFRHFLSDGMHTSFKDLRPFAIYNYTGKWTERKPGRASKNTPAWYLPYSRVYWGPMARRVLIVNADDFGRTPGVSEGILQAHQEGVVTSTSVMVNFPAAEQAVRRARDLAPALGMGVHLNLTTGLPVLPPEEVPSLIGPEGRFLPIRRRVSCLDDLDLGQVMAELEAQVRRLQSWGVGPTHLDAHHHLLYLSPRLFDLLLRLARSHRLPIRYPWPRGPLDAEEVDHLAEAHRVPAERLPRLIAACESLLEQAGVPAPDRCVLSFYGPEATLDHLLDVIAGLPEGITELMCHPGWVDAPLRAESGYVEGRRRELAVLTDPQVREALTRHGVCLANFRLLRARLPRHDEPGQPVAEPCDEEGRP